MYDLKKINLIRDDLGYLAVGTFLIQISLVFVAPKCRGMEEREEFDLPPLEMHSHDHVDTTTATEVLLTAFSRQGCCLRN